MANAPAILSAKLILQTGRAESIKYYYSEISASYLGWGVKGKAGIIWEGSGLNEVG